MDVSDRIDQMATLIEDDVEELVEEADLEVPAIMEMLTTEMKARLQAL